MLQLIDTTCPLVRRLHEAALELQAEGRHVLLIGDSGHAEVRGIVDHLASYDVVLQSGEVRCYESRRLGIVCQTTMPSGLVADICSHILLHNPLADIRRIDTACRPTKLGRRAMFELLHRVDVVVVVGRRDSTNTRRLVRLFHRHLTPAFHVACAEELKLEWFADVRTVGLTAINSTLDETIDAVRQALERIAFSRQQGKDGTT